MRLYRPVSTEYARHVIDHGFISDYFASLPNWTDEELADFDALDDEEAKLAFFNAINADDERERIQRVEFRDIPPGGLELSRAAEMVGEVEDDSSIKLVVTGPAIVSDMGDFVLSVEIPDEEVAEYEVKEDEPMGWPFREYWVPLELVNSHLDSLIVYGWENDVELYEVRPDLVGK